MRFYLISDNADTLVGMRLAGIDGELVHDAQSVEDAVNRCLAADSRDPRPPRFAGERLHRALCARHYRHKDLRCLTNAQSGRKSRKVF